MPRPLPALALALLALATTAHASDRLAGFDRVVIDDDLPGAYQVEVADVNGDGRPDLVALGGGTCAWYENPGWTKRLVSGPDRTPGIISTATADLDGDGRAEVAVAYEFEMNAPRRGKLLLARQGASAEVAWSYEPMGDLGSIHRLRFGDVDADGRRDLVIAPIFGKAATPPAYDQESPKVVVLLGLGADGRSRGREAFRAGPVLHAIDVLDLDGDGRSDVLTADNHGLTAWSRRADGAWSSTPLTRGEPGEAPKRGSSEVHVGRLADGSRFLAAVEPWHGTKVAIHTRSGADSEFGRREVIDETLRDGHALWVADVDGDGDDEVLAGFRGPGTSVLAFDRVDGRWERSVVDPAIAAQDLRGGDLDGDGRPDVVAVGGSTHNVVWYRPKRAGAR